MKLTINVPKEDYEQIKKYEDGVTFYPITIRLYKAVQKGKIADAQKYKDVKEHIMLLAGDYKCYNNTLTHKEAVELCNMLETRTGHWIDMGAERGLIYHNVYKCSECGYLNLIKYNFCPRCGARLIKESEVSE